MIRIEGIPMVAARLADTQKMKSAQARDNHRKASNEGSRRRQSANGGP